MTNRRMDAKISRRSPTPPWVQPRTGADSRPTSGRPTGCGKFTVTVAMRIPLGAQRGNSRTHRGGPSPRQPAMIDAWEKFSLRATEPQSRGTGPSRWLRRETCTETLARGPRPVDGLSRPGETVNRLNRERRGPPEKITEI